MFLEPQELQNNDVGNRKNVSSLNFRRTIIAEKLEKITTLLIKPISSPLTVLCHNKAGKKA